jgi:pimeloyl-ACP methyl ester carboxylesterase
VQALQAEQARPPPGRFVEVDGLPVHYIARGKGRPVVLLHGNGTMAEDFLICGLVDQLAKQYRVIAIDRPGFGHTKRPRHRIWTASAQAHLVHRVLDRLNVERPVVVAHSWGTLVALALTMGSWRELRGLVLLSGYYYAGHRADLALSAPLAIPGFGDAARAMVPHAVGQLLAPEADEAVRPPLPVRLRIGGGSPLMQRTAQRPARRSCQIAAANQNSAGAPV